jgi:hypothetical protein
LLCAVTFGAIGVYTAGAGTSPVPGCQAVYASVPHSTENPLVQRRAANAYARQEHVSITVAFARLRIQDATTPLVDSLQAIFGPRWAGAWYAPRDCGRLHLGAVHPKQQQLDAVTRILRAHHLTAAVMVATVRWSMQALVRAQGVVTRQLQRLLKAGKVVVAVDPAANSVYVGTVRRLASSERQIVAKAARAVKVRVRVARTRLGSLKPVFAVWHP